MGYCDIKAISLWIEKKTEICTRLFERLLLNEMWNVSLRHHSVRKQVMA